MNPSIHRDLQTHSPPSPPGAAETFFLSLNQPSEISAYALAATLRSNTYTNSSRADSVRSVQSGYYTPNEDEFSVDQQEEDTEEDIICNNMANKNKKKSAAAAYAENDAKPAVVEAEPVVAINEATASSPKSESTGVDVTQHVYEGVKDIWGAAAGIGVFSPFLKTAEGIANKVLSVKGLDLEKVDNAVKPLLSNVDGAVNPHISAILEAVKPIVEKIMPVVMAPVGLILHEKKASHEESESTPEVTPSPVVQ